MKDIRWPLSLSRRAIGLSLLLALAATLPAAAQKSIRPGRDDLPKGFRQLLPRGRIASVDNPQFVTAAEAKIPDEAWVLGVVVDGEARAYSLNLLNRHEVVNDRIADRPIAAVW